MNDTTLIDKYIDKIFELEGDYSNDDHDNGGETRWGITINEARKNGYDGDMRALPKELARQIYAKRYWFDIKLDKVCALSDVIAYKLFDAGINMGPSVPIKMMQEALNDFNDTELETDGIIGNNTLEALKQYLDKRQAQDGERVLLTSIECKQGVYYFNICKRNPTQRKFIYGWIRNRVR